MQLIHLKDQIDAGKTAKLFSPRSRPGGVEITVRIRRERDREGVEHYVWQHTTEGKRPYPEIAPTQTVLHITWEALWQDIEGHQTRTFDWSLCDEPLIDYLPPERQTVSSGEQQAPLL